MRKLTIVIIIFILAVLISTYFNQEQEQAVIHVSAASSLRGALDEIQVDLADQDYKIEINYGGSGTLVTQIQEGAPCDIFISASEQNFDNLVISNEMIEQTTLLTNQLVLIGNENIDINDLSQLERLAIGTPDVVPAGTYAMQVLKNRGLDQELSDKLVQTKDVAEVVTYVESNNVDAGIVYQSDAQNLTNSQLLYTFGADEHEPIIYPIGLLTESQAAKDFYDYLSSDEAQAIFIKYGFDMYE